MDVGVDLNAKYAIMCRKTVLIPENDEESTHSAPLAFVTLQSTSASLPSSLHIWLPKYVNWFTSLTECPFRTIALGRGCLELVVDEFTILMDLVFSSVDFKSKRSCLIFK